MMNEIGGDGWKDNVIGQAKEKFNLTAHEVTIVRHLLKGWTNKEIANEMGLAEQKMKEYFKRILAKTNTTTRTGIIMRVVQGNSRAQ